MEHKIFHREKENVFCLIPLSITYMYIAKLYYLKMSSKSTLAVPLFNFLWFFLKK